MSENGNGDLVERVARAIRDAYEELPDGSYPELTGVHDWHGEARAALAEVNAVSGVESEYEYRLLHRAKGSDDAWSPVYTNRGAGRPYRTVGAARGVMSREKREDERRHRTNPKYWPLQEYKIQRRPVTAGWEDVQ
ncbi:hypothetical protein [Saccharopolyspora hattusasensis]|uniref:hypothetical protein n=1 Tax=Saccharopolyspora hattusasensis TaxID=1128679 RepID=UPI003D99CD7A